MTSNEQEHEVPWGIIALTGLSLAALALLVATRRDLLARFTPQEQLRLRFIRDLYRRGVLRR